MFSGEVLLDKISQAKTVVAKNGSLSEDSNIFRLLPMEVRRVRNSIRMDFIQYKYTIHPDGFLTLKVIAGNNSTITKHSEHGNIFQLDLAETYWNSVSHNES